MPFGSFLVCNPLCCLMKMNAAPMLSITVATIRATRKPITTYKTKKDNNAPPTAPAAQPM